MDAHYCFTSLGKPPAGSCSWEEYILLSAPAQEQLPICWRKIGSLFLDIQITHTRAHLYVHIFCLHPSGLCIPANNTIFIKSISEKLAEKEPHLTLEFLEECIQGFGNSNIEMKHLCLEYITPWLPNLTRYLMRN